jgi:4-hydroxy 2-oxovalerate aldolase
LHRNQKDPYVADSFGSMTPNRVAALVSLLVERCPVSVGFHGHDNMGMALLNSVAAMNAGATWIDSTVAGMGRGAGNTATEELCMLLDAQGNARFDTLLERHFSALKERYGWGASVLYRVAAQRRLHPMYVQELPTGEGLDASARADMLRAIPSDRASTFDRGVLEAVVHAR